MPTIAPFLVPEIRLSAITAEPAPGVTDTAMPTPALRTTFPVTLTSRRYCPQPTEMPAIGAFSMMLPVTAVSASTPIPMPVPSFGSVPAGRFGSEIADQVALYDREAAALIEVGHRDADGGAVDRVVGDDRALEAELRIDRDFAEPRAGVVGDLDVRGRIAAHRREGRIA